MVSLNYLNMAENILIVGTSVNANLSIYEYFLILLDLFVIFYFTFTAIELYRENKN